MSNRLSDFLASQGKILNVANIVPLVGDGVTDNSPAFEAFSGNRGNPAFNYGGFLSTQGTTMPYTVTLTLGSPGVVNLNSHGLRVNDCVVFNSTGALPTGLVAGQFYWVMYTGLTLNSFQVSATNANYVQAVSPATAPTPGDGPAVNFTGSQSGTQTITFPAHSWQEVVIPPGAYYCSTDTSVALTSKRLRINAYGVDSNNLEVAQRSFCAGYGGFCNSVNGAPQFTGALITGSGAQGVAVYSTSVYLPNYTVDAAKFWIGGWVLIGALDVQNTLGSEASFPPNNQYYEYAQISAINTGTGQVNLTAPLKYGYSTTFPAFVSSNVQTPNASDLTTFGGPATMWPMSPYWDAEVELRGLRNTDSTEGICTGRRVIYTDVTYENGSGGGQQGPAPSGCQEVIFDNCTFNYGGSIEIDKNIEFFRFKNCAFLNNSGLLLQSAVPNILEIDGCQINGMGTAKNTHVKDSAISSVFAGVGFYGTAESLLIENSQIAQFQEQFPLYAQSGQGAAFEMAVNNYTFSGGVLSTPLQSAPNFWPVPGRKCYVSDLNFAFDSMGSPFTVLNVYPTDGSSATVTFSNPSTINWTAHGLSAGNLVWFSNPFGPGTGLPTGIYTYFPYYVISTGLVTNSFEVSTTPGGSAVTFISSSSGTTTGHANSLFNIATNLTALPVGNSTNSTVTISNGSPAVVTWTSHGLTAGTPVFFQTTGALPTGMNTTTMYYVLAAGLLTNSFEFSTSVGGSAVNTSSAGSGTQTAVANPLIFKMIHIPKITVINSGGCPQIADISNSPPNLPLFSFASRRLMGSPDTTGGSLFYFPSMQLRGNLVSLTIEVEQVATGGACVLDLTAKAFNSSLIESDMSFAIDCTIAGTRIVTPLGVTGAQATDTLSAFGNWISGEINLAFASANGQPVIRVTAQTDQGDPVVINALTSPDAHTSQIVDTVPYEGFITS